MHVNVWPSGRYSAMCECRSGQSQTFPGQAELLTSAKQSPRPEVSWGFPGTREQLPMHVLEMLGAAEVSREVKKPAVKLQLNLGRLSWLHSRQSRALWHAQHVLCRLHVLAHFLSRDAAALPITARFRNQECELALPQFEERHGQQQRLCIRQSCL